MRWLSLTPTEHQEQKAVIQWAQAMQAVLPQACLIFAIPNGGLRPKRFGGFRRGKPVQFSAEGKKLQAEGVKPGVPDLFLPVARHGLFGLFIEMKRQGESTTPDQEFWHIALRNQNYAVCVCRGADAAIEVIRSYLLGPIWSGPTQRESDGKVKT